jgi:hypothetical protein
MICFSCEKQGFTVYCPDCTVNEPKVADLDVYVETNNIKTGTVIIIKIYEGNLEDSVLIRSDTYPAYLATNFAVTLNKKYTLTATYYIANNVFIAVDSATPRVKYTREQCDNACYYIYDRTIDLRLKYIY